MTQTIQKPKNILIVEDNVDVRKLCSKALKLENYSVLDATNGKEAFAIMDGNFCPDLILLDLTMPQMDGVEFIDLLRKHSKCSESKVVIVSGWDDISARAKELGAAGWVRKPIDLTSLYKEVAKHF